MTPQGLRQTRYLLTETDPRILPRVETEVAFVGRSNSGKSSLINALCQQKKLARVVAIKVLPVELGDAPGFADRFRREAMTTAGLAHPDIVAVHDTGETVAGHLYYVMDFVDGEDLALHMARGRMTVEESVALLATVCGAVEAAHARGIVHRDIKPSNFFITRRPDGSNLLKILDFWISKSFG